MRKIKQFLQSYYGSILLIALFFRLLVMPFFFHPDIKVQHFQAHFLSQGVLNIYDFLQANIAQLPYKGNFVYPPVAYFFFGILQILLKPFLGVGFTEWLFNWGEGANFIASIFRYLFILKLPYLMVDIAIAFFLLTFFKKEQEKRRVFCLWLFNPVVIFAIEAIGQFDVVPAFLTLLSVCLFAKKRRGWAALSLGVGAAFKSYPLLLLPFLVILGGRKTFERIRLFFLGVAPYVVTIFPFLSSLAFRESVLFSGLSLRIFTAGIGIGFGETLIVFIILYTTLLLSAWKKTEREDLLWRYYLTVLLLIFVFSHFHPQWIVWLVPFLTLALGKQKNLLIPQTVLYLAFLGIVILFNDRFLSFGLVAPINPNFADIPTLYEVLRGRELVNPEMVQSLFHSVFAGAALFIIWEIFREKRSHV